MCGRFTITLTFEELMLRFGIDQPTNRYHTPRYNVAPGQLIMSIIHDGAVNRIGELKWGLVPFWAEDEKIGNKMINARSETLMEKPSFRGLIARKRCIVPADGFYEWKKSGNVSQPMRITMRDRSLFSMAALYDTWLSPDGRKVSTCSILTTEPNSLVADIHNRMPVILHKDEEQIWLNRHQTESSRLLELLKPFPAEKMTAYPVSPLVGSVKNDSEACIEPMLIV